MGGLKNDEFKLERYNLNCGIRDYSVVGSQRTSCSEGVIQCLQ